MTQNGIVLVVSVSILKDNEVLIIKENKPFAINKWNFPSGRIENKEDILHAACREVKEETGFDVKLTGTTGIYNFISSSNHQVILFHFIGELTGGSLKLEENEIVDSKWIRLSELMNLPYQKLRDANVIKQIVNRLLNEKIHSLAIFNEPLKGEVLNED
ncbi:NUDIX domain-containing protein [Cytobacillus depressus]|uniref:NUDIX domain-containing protein n=1 Tax=Cytobacillus depressus TaxID=1602942 RepID=A0A6L3V5A3_9BACI|nr:NUDIX domain-containing protein [Cytobacillus depressus]KAB2334539.1 NUDIX domain-containing protein [Cytobacillus depressus]